MADETVKAGTSNPSGGEAEDRQTSAPEETTAEPQSEPEVDWRKKYLEEGLPAQEERNRLKAKVAELEARPATPDPEPADDDDLSADATQALQFTGTDPVARLAVKQARIIKKLEQRLDSNERDSILVRQLDRMKLPEDKEKKVMEHFVQNRHRLGDMKAAKAEVEEQEMRAENERLRRENDLLRRKPSEDQVTPNAPPTHGQSTGKPPKVQEMTEEQFYADKERIRAEQGLAAALKFGAQVTGTSPTIKLRRG